MSEERPQVFYPDRTVTVRRQLSDPALGLPVGGMEAVDSDAAARVPGGHLPAGPPEAVGPDVVLDGAGDDADQAGSEHPEPAYWPASILASWLSGPLRSRSSRTSRRAVSTMELLEAFVLSFWPASFFKR